MKLVYLLSVVAAGAAVATPTVRDVSSVDNASTSASTATPTLEDTSSVGSTSASASTGSASCLPDSCVKYGVSYHEFEWQRRDMMLTVDGSAALVDAVIGV